MIPTLLFALVVVLGALAVASVRIRRLEARLARTSASRRAMLDSVDSAVAVLRRDSTILEVNEHWKHFGGNPDVPAGCGPGVSYIEVCRNSIAAGCDDAALALDGLQRVLTGQERRFRMDYSMQGPDGCRWYTLAVLGQGSPDEAAVVIHTDTTERVATAESLRRSEALFHGVYDNAPVGIAEIGLDGAIIMANRGLCALLGYSEQELRHRLECTLTEGSAPGAETHLAKRLLEGEIDRYVIDRQYVRKDGERIWVSVTCSLLKSSSGVPAARLSIFTDISERKRAETALRETVARLRLAVEAGRMFAFRWDAVSDRLQRSFDQARIFKGIPPAFLSTRTGYLQAVDLDDRQRVLETVAGLTPEQPGYSLLYRVALPDGQVWLQEQGRGQFDAQGKLLVVVGMSADVTQLKVAEESRHQLVSRLLNAQEQERTRIGRELHDGIAQRLALIAISLDRMRLNAGSGPKQEELRGAWLEVCDVGAEVQRLSHELHSAKLQHLGLEAALRSLCEACSRKLNIPVTFTTSGIGSPASGEVTHGLYRVAQEALRNIAKHSEAKNASVNLSGDGAELVLSVSDDGLGFDPKNGACQGLGLVSMEERICHLGGRFQISSTLGKGTVLTARVPRQPES